MANVVFDDGSQSGKVLLCEVLPLCSWDQANMEKSLVVVCVKFCISYFTPLVGQLATCHVISRSLSLSLLLECYFML